MELLSWLKRMNYAYQYAFRDLLFLGIFMVVVCIISFLFGLDTKSDGRARLVFSRITTWSGILCAVSLILCAFCSPMGPGGPSSTNAKHINYDLNIAQAKSDEVHDSKLMSQTRGILETDKKALDMAQSGANDLQSGGKTAQAAQQLGLDRHATHEKVVSEATYDLNHGASRYTALRAHREQVQSIADRQQESVHHPNAIVNTISKVHDMI